MVYENYVTSLFKKNLMGKIGQFMPHLDLTTVSWKAELSCYCMGILCVGICFTFVI